MSDVLRFWFQEIPTDNKEGKKTKHAHMKMEIKENATRTNTN
jgi:hypothetical protein